MAELKATEFEEILSGDYDTPCYVDNEELFKHALAVNRPIVVLFNDGAVKQIPELVKIGKEKEIIKTSTWIVDVEEKVSITLTAINIATNAPIALIKEGITLVLEETIIKLLLDNIEKFKDYHMLLDEKNDRAIFLSKKIEKDKHPAILENIYSDFVSATTEMIDEYDNIFKVTDAFRITGKGTVLCGKVLKGEFSVEDKVKCVDGKLTEYATEKLIGIEQFRKLLNKASAGAECGLLIDIKDDAFRKEIEKQRLLLKDIYVIK